MINESAADFEPLIGAKLKEIKFEDSEFHFIFDNKRQFTGHLRIHVKESAIVPRLDAFCGYCKGHKDLVSR